MKYEAARARASDPEEASIASTLASAQESEWLLAFTRKCTALRYIYQQRGMFQWPSAARRYLLKEAALATRSNGELQSADGMLKTSGLCIIVKNELHVIVRRLESVRPSIEWMCSLRTQGQSTAQYTNHSEMVRSEMTAGDKVFHEPWAYASGARRTPLKILS